MLENAKQAAFGFLAADVVLVYWVYLVGMGIIILALLSLSDRWKRRKRFKRAKHSSAAKDLLE